MYPRLVQKYGREYAKQMVLNPRINVNERSHAVVGACTTRTREGYTKGWKRSLQKRIKPQRHIGNSSFGFSEADATNALKLKTCTMNVAKALSSIREPQLCDSYDVGNTIGVGREGVVRPGFTLKVSDIEDEIRAAQLASRPDSVAVKSLNKLDSYSQFRGPALRREVDVLEKIKDHPNIIKLYDVFESPINLHIVLQMCKGGDLFTFLNEHNFETQNEKDVARVTLKLLTAVCALHEQGFVHRDIKLENIMRTENGDDIDAGEIVLIDFGHAKRITQKNQCDKLKRPVGSPSYAAPEVVLEKTFNQNSDLWSVGVVLYILLQGYLPYPHLQRKKWREFEWDDYISEENDPFCYEGDWEDISPSAKAFTKALLEVDPAKRLTVEETFAHPWFAEQGYAVVRDANGLPIVKEIDAVADDGKKRTSDEGFYSHMPSMVKKKIASFM